MGGRGTWGFKKKIFWVEEGQKERERRREKKKRKREKKRQRRREKYSERERAQIKGVKKCIRVLYNAKSVNSTYRTLALFLMIGIVTTHLTYPTLLLYDVERRSRPTSLPPPHPVQPGPAPQKKNWMNIFQKNGEIKVKRVERKERVL